MNRRALLRTILRPAHFRRAPTRPYSADIKPAPTSHSRIERFNRRLPSFLHKYTRALGNAPLSHITSFLILHELTAIIPLFGLAAYFHYTHWLPSWFAEGAFVLNGVERFGRYFKRKGWIRSDEAEEAVLEVRGLQHDKEVIQQDNAGQNEKRLRKVDKAWNLSEGGVRLVVEFATAYAITKALLVPRIMFSVWATPAFARWTVVPIVARVGRLFKRGKGKTNLSASGGTGDVKSSVVPRGGSARSS